MATALPKYGTSDSGNVNLLEAAQSNAEVSQNSINKLLAIAGSTIIVTSELSTPPGSPSEADAHLVGSSPTGDWSAFDEGDIAIYLDSAWYELDPFTGLGMVRADKDEALYRYNGTAWVESPSSVTTGITAEPSGVQGDVPLVSKINEVTTVASLNDSVTLPTAVAGIEVVVINSVGTAMDVFPASGDDIDGGSANAATTVAGNAVARFYAVDAASWYKLEA